jgi:hypothetical protein
MKEWEAALVRFMNSSNPELTREIAVEKRLNDELSEKLDAALDTFKATWH